MSKDYGTESEIRKELDKLTTKEVIQKLKSWLYRPTEDIGIINTEQLMLERLEKDLVMLDTLKKGLLFNITLTQEEHEKIKEWLGMTSKIDKQALKEYDSFNRKRYEARKDKENIYPIGITDKEFRNIIIELLLGKDWYTSDPLSPEQVNEEALEQIIYNITGKTYKERDNDK